MLLITSTDRYILWLILLPFGHFSLALLKLHWLFYLFRGSCSVTLPFRSVKLCSIFYSSLKFMRSNVFAFWRDLTPWVLMMMLVFCFLLSIPLDYRWLQSYSELSLLFKISGSLAFIIIVSYCCFIRWYY